VQAGRGENIMGVGRGLDAELQKMNKQVNKHKDSFDSRQF